MMKENIFKHVYSPPQISLLLADTIELAIGSEVVVDSYSLDNSGVQVNYQDLEGNPSSGVLSYEGKFV